MDLVTAKNNLIQRASHTHEGLHKVLSLKEGFIAIDLVASRTEHSWLSCNFEVFIVLLNCFYIHEQVPRDSKRPEQGTASPHF